MARPKRSYQDMSLRRIYVGYCVLRECHHRLTGVSREASLPTTLFVFAVLAGAVGSIVARPVSALKRLLPGRPSLAATGMALAACRHVTSSIAGERLQGTPYANAIVASGFAAPALQVLSLPAQLLRAAGGGVARMWRYLMDTPVRPGVS